MTATQEWVLTDQAQGLWLEELDLEGGALGLAAEAGWSLRKRRLRGGLSEGVDLIEVDNGAMQFSVLPTRGMGLWRGACEGVELGWRSPVRGPVHPWHVDAGDRAGLGWLEGFDEWVVRCGLESNGPPCEDPTPGDGPNVPRRLTLHGRIANRPAHRVWVEFIDGDPPRLAVCGEVEESALFFPQLRLSTRLETELGSKRLRIRDAVVNAGAREAELELLYHCNFGRNLLEEGARLAIAAEEVCPRDAVAARSIGTFDTFQAPEAGFAEQVYFVRPRADAQGRTLAVLRNFSGDRAAALRFDVHRLPCFTLWKNTAAECDGYVTGLEPATNYPNAKPFERERDRVVKLDAGTSYRCELEIEVASRSSEVRALEDEVARLQGGRKARLLGAPDGLLAPQ